MRHGMSEFPDSDPGKDMRTDSASLHNREFYDHAANEGYADGAPHLKHRRIRELYDRLLKDAMTGCSGRRVLDLGAGNGQITRLFFERDAQVTAVDISEAQLRELQSVCAAGKGRLKVHCGDATAFMAECTDSWDIIIANSFLHHVPDYAALMVAAARKLAAGGLIITFQDPLRYDALTWSSRLFSAGSYFCWRVVQRDVLAGMARRIRRSFGRYDPASMHDNAEYHVVRNGVDHLALEKELRAIGMLVQATCYFSAHAVWCQWLGERLGMVNHFALVVRKPC
jgi:SAM-dependent methyltransferase